MHLKKSKSFVFLLFSAVLLWALTACGGRDESTPPPVEDSAQQEVAKTENTSTPTAAAPTSTPIPPTSTPIPPTPTPAPTDTPPADSGTEENTVDTSILPDFPLPEDAQDVAYEFSEIIFTSPSDIETLVDFYRDALLTDNILPPAGQARIYLVNFSDDELTVTINDQVFKIAAGVGMESPDDAPNLDLPPGTYEVTTEVGSISVTDEVIIGPDETWGLLLDEAGALPLQIY
jgi:hypothetical protein